jgi:hypothetical protein
MDWKQLAQDMRDGPPRRDWWWLGLLMLVGTSGLAIMTVGLFLSI